MSRRSLISIVAFVLLCTVTASAYEYQDFVGEYYIPVGIPVIDGNISPNEWDHANWLQLDKLYYQDPPDLSDASWAALWSPETNLIYVVVTGTDTDHVFGDGYWDETDWNNYDMAEVYFDPSNSDVAPYQQIQDPAQQWMGANNTTGGSWVMLPIEHLHYPDKVLPEELRPELVSTVVGDLYTYEFALTPYEAFGWLTGRLDKILQLETDMRVGLDVVMSSKSTNYGMLCENAWDGSGEGPDGIIDTEDDGIITIGKYRGAERFLDHSLIKDPNQAWRPRPGNKAIDAPSAVILKWNPGKNAESHDIYFGSSFEDVDNATDPYILPVGRGNQPLEDNTYQPPAPEVPLALDGTYYWRIDEVSGTTVTKGNVWRFTVTNFLVIEDFDSYAVNEALWNVWIDGAANLLTRSEIYLETAITRDGNSIKYIYKNSLVPFYSEIEASIDDLLVTPDWTAYAARALTLWFYGTGDNEAQQMYLALEDQTGHLAVVPYGGDANDLKNPMWQQWDINLQEFNDINEVDLSSIAKIYIGFGDRFDPTYGGLGYVYFDDIRLYLQRCITEYVEVDFTGDCFVNLDDLEILATDWLQTDFNVDINEPNGELIWYMFDHDSTKNTAVDSSEDPYDGYVSDAVWTTEGRIDGALIFDRDQDSYVDVPPEALSSVTTRITIALWQFGNPEKQPFEDNLFQGNRVSSNLDIRVLNVHLPSVDSVVYWDAGNPSEVWSTEVWRECERIEKEAEFDDYAGQWNHWTFVKNCDANDGKGVMKMYLNGALFHIGYDVNVPLDIFGTIDNFKIGSGPDSSYSGTIDDFRIYNYELLQDQIDYLATAGSGYYPLQSSTANLVPKLPPPTSYDPNDPDIINLLDYAVLADSWMKEMLWPQ